MPTLEQVLKDAQSLPLDDQRLLNELLGVPKSLAQLAAEQGVKPFDFAEARQAADFWPEDDDIDDFLATLRKWRTATLAQWTTDLTDATDQHESDQP